MDTAIKRKQFNNWRNTKAGKNFIKLLHEVQAGLCNKCELPLKDYHVDHILSITNNGGNDLANYQLLCARCNTSKGNRDDIDSVIYTDRIVAKRVKIYTTSYYLEEWEDCYNQLMKLQPRTKEYQSMLDRYFNALKNYQKKKQEEYQKKAIDNGWELLCTN